MVNIWRNCPSSRLSTINIVDFVDPSMNNTEEVCDQFFENRAALKVWTGSAWKIKSMEIYFNNVWSRKLIKINLGNGWELVRT